MDENFSRRKPRRLKKSRCVDCENAIFDEVWGEFKCRIKKHRVYNPDEYTDCKSFKRARSGNERRSNN